MHLPEILKLVVQLQFFELLSVCDYCPSNTIIISPLQPNFVAYLLPYLVFIDRLCNAPAMLTCKLLVANIYIDDCSFCSHILLVIGLQCDIFLLKSL